MAYTDKIAVKSTMRLKFDNRDYSHIEVEAVETVVLEDGDDEAKVRAAVLKLTTEAVGDRCMTARQEYDDQLAEATAAATTPRRR